MKSYQCVKCQKEISSGKFYSFFSGKKGGKRMFRYQVYERSKNNFFCPTCASQEKAEPPENIGRDNLLEIEWEVGNETDEQILYFEEKWNKYYLNNEFTKQDQDTDEKTILTWCQNARKELEPYLQKPEIVKKSCGGEIEGYGKADIWLYFLFAKSAREENYRKEVVEPIIAEILGVEKLEQEINTTIKGSGSGAAGLADGKLEIGDKIINYQWIDGPQGGHFRRISFEVSDPWLALQSFCRSLKIKEKELGGDNSPKPNPKKICAECEKNISGQEGSWIWEMGEWKKEFCSAECLEKAKNKDNKSLPNNNSNSQNENNSEKKGMSTGLKIFLGVSAVVLFLIVIIIFIGMRGHKNTSRERERETKNSNICSKIK